MHEQEVADAFADVSTEEFRRTLAHYLARVIPPPLRERPKRTPPVALRLPHGEWVCVARPRWRSAYNPPWHGYDPDAISCEMVHPLFDGKLPRAGRGVGVGVTFQPGKAPECWCWSFAHGPEALGHLAELAGFFPIMPESCFAASKTNCCICGKKLTDDGSKARGVGPDCLTRLGGTLALPDDQMDDLPVLVSPKYRSIDDE